MDGKTAFTLKIWRFDPTLDRTPWYESYSLPPGEWHRVRLLDVLRYIHENCDPGLSFREGCGQGFCKGCAVGINNRVKLACKVFPEKDMVIEPCPNRTVIKDIVTE